MLLKRIKIDTANLEQGMYVSQLDRSWLETPFLFQGFEIREDSEIALLRKFCKHVYVDVTRSTLEEKKILAARQTAGSQPGQDAFATAKFQASLQRPAPLQWKILSAFSRFDPTGFLSERLNRHARYKKLVSTRKEAPQAERAYDVAVEGLNDVFESIRKGSGVNVDKVKQTVAPMIESVLRNHDAMAWLAYLRKHDEYAYNHSVSSSVWAVILGRHLGFDRHALNSLAMGSVLLDIGKAKIPESILLKEGPLTDDEAAIMRLHVDYGTEIARITPGISDDILAMIKTHHERHDGSGYPNGISGVDIPVFGRIAGLVDSYSAMTTHRPYAPAKSSYDAVRELNAQADMLFQREMVERFVQAVGMFPTGSLVEINTGEVGVVIEQDGVHRLRPRIMLVLNAGKEPVKSNRILNLRKLSSNAASPKARWIVQGYEDGAFGIDPKDYFL